MIDSLVRGIQLRVSPTPTEWIDIYSDKLGVLVRIHHSGEMTFGPNYRPDEAAQIFWGVVVGLTPSPMFRPLAGYTTAELELELARRKPN